MANCVPCLKLGLQLVAHYPANRSAGKDAECYYHHFGMPLPASIQAKIAQPKVAAPVDEATLHKKALAWADRCDRDQAKENGLDVDEVRKNAAPAKKSDVQQPQKLPIPPARPKTRAADIVLVTNEAGSVVGVRPATKEEIAERQDASLGKAARLEAPTERTNMTHKDENASGTAKPTTEEPVISQPAKDAATATLLVTHKHMDNFWSKLSLQEKAAIFQRQLEGV